MHWLARPPRLKADLYLADQFTESLVEGSDITLDDIDDSLGTILVKHREEHDQFIEDPAGYPARYPDGKIIVLGDVSRPLLWIVDEDGVERKWFRVHFRDVKRLHERAKQDRMYAELKKLKANPNLKKPPPQKPGGSLPLPPPLPEADSGTGKWKCIHCSFVDEAKFKSTVCGGSSRKVGCNKPRVLVSAESETKRRQAANDVAWCALSDAQRPKHPNPVQSIHWKIAQAEWNAVCKKQTKKAFYQGFVFSELF